MLLVYFLFLLLPLKAYSFEVTIKTLYEGHPVPSTIKVWNKGPVIRKDSPDFVHDSGVDGAVKIDIEGGEYYIFAEKVNDDSFYFGFYGQNPLSVRQNDEITVNLVKYPKNFIEKKGDREISGVVMYKGKPIKDVGVFAYLDLTSELKGPSFFSTITDDRGRFNLELEEGSYYIIFRKKSAEQFGPPSPGDFVGFFPIFPIELRTNGYDIKVSLLKIPDKMRTNLRDKSYLIKGKVIDKNNKPKRGVYVVLYEDYTLLGKPDYVSHQTDLNGEFSIYVKKSGSYFVVLRKSLGDTPQLGENVSSYTEVKIDEKDTVKEILIKTDD